MGSIIPYIKQQTRVLNTLILLIPLQDLPGVFGEGAEAVMEEVGNSRFFLCGPIKDVGHIMRWLWLDDVRCTWGIHTSWCFSFSPPRTSQVQRCLTHFRFSGRWTPWKRPCSKLLGVQRRMLLDHGGWMSDHHQLWYELRCLSISTISHSFSDIISSPKMVQVFGCLTTSSQPTWGCSGWRHEGAWRISVEDQNGEFHFTTKQHLKQCTTKSLYHKFSSQKMSESQWNYRYLRCNGMQFEQIYLTNSTDVCAEQEAAWSVPQPEISAPHLRFAAYRGPNRCTLWEQWRTWGIISWLGSCQHFPSPSIWSMSIRIINI